MKTIKIFLASSEELKDERQKFGNLIRQLDDIYIKRGIHVQLLVWEDMDPSYNNCRKQDEYNAWIRESQIFVALFYTRAGQYTMEELKVAQQENYRKQEPKLMIYCRSLQPGDFEGNDLLEFKQTLEKQLGLFWGNYATTDKLHLDFVMYFMRSTEGHSSALKVEKGNIVLDGLTVATMDNLPFATGNEGYQHMQAEIQELSKEVEKKRAGLEKKEQRLRKKRAIWEKDPYNEYNHEEYEEAKEEVEDLTLELQSKIDKYNAILKQFTNYQQALLDTAKRVSEMQLEKVSSELHQAIEEFENGHIEAANTILDGIEHEAERHIEQLEQQKSLVHQDIKAFCVQTKTLMADAKIPIEERINRVAKIYAKADDWAEKSSLEKEKYIDLLVDYSRFLLDYAFYDKAEITYLRLISMQESFYSIEHPKTTKSYNRIGIVYEKQGHYEKALEYLSKALAINEKILGTEHPDTAAAYDNIGVVYHVQNDYDKALEYHLKALEIREKVLGMENTKTAGSYNNIGEIYNNQGKYDIALKYHLKALEIRKKALGTDSSYTAMSYNNTGSVYAKLGDFEKAFEFFYKAMTIYQKVYGPRHPITISFINNIKIGRNC